MKSAGRGIYDYETRGRHIKLDDIQSINVLKGAAATALYGIKGNQRRHLNHN